MKGRQSGICEVRSGVDGKNLSISVRFACVMGFEPLNDFSRENRSGTVVNAAFAIIRMIVRCGFLFLNYFSNRYKKGGSICV